MLPTASVPLSLPRRRALVAGAIAGFVLFFVPLPSGPPHLGYGLELAETYHALYFSFLPFVLLALRGFPAGRGRGAAAFLAAAAVSAAVEVLQPFFGRSCELGDFAVGAAAAAVSAAAFSARLPLPRRFAAAAAGALLLLFAPSAARQWMLGRPSRAAFPVLYAPAERCFFTPWDLHGVALAPDGTVRPTGEEADYPGLFRLPARGDWRAFSALALRVEWPGPDGAVGVLRADPADKRDPAYDERLQREVPLAHGENEILLPLDAAPFDLARTGVWGFFLVSPGRFDYFRLIDARLLPAPPTPNARP